jgi:hypothetical protein
MIFSKKKKVFIICLFLKLPIIPRDCSINNTDECNPFYEPLMETIVYFIPYCSLMNPLF